MPGSHPQQINEIVEIMRLIQPQSLLDVGVGFGKYGVLAREQLDLWEGAGKSRAEYQKWQRRVDGVEAYEGYLTPLHSFVYDQIYVGDARVVVPTLGGSYDLAFLIDVIEHLDREAGFKLIRDLRRISRNVLISTPKKVGPQEPLYENQFERHVSQWNESDFRSLPGCAVIPNGPSLICFIGEDVGKVEALLRRGRRQKFKDSVATLFPFLRWPYKFLKSVLRRR